MRIFAGWFVMLCVFFGICSTLGYFMGEQELRTKLLAAGRSPHDAAMDPAVTLAEIRNRLSLFDAPLKWFLLACGVAIWGRLDRAWRTAAATHAGHSDALATLPAATIRAAQRLRQIFFSLPSRRLRGPNKIVTTILFDNAWVAAVISPPAEVGEA